jgi:hypothetical protein
MRSVKPIYKGLATRSLEQPNYGKGYVGFSFRDNNLMSKGIAYFTRGEYEGIVPSHAFVVENDTTIIEAHFPHVRRYPIQEYFNDPHVIVFFKKPHDLKPFDAHFMLERAGLHVGSNYDASVLVYFVGRWIREKFNFGKIPPSHHPAFWDSPESFMCSELVSDALNQIPKYSNLLPLSEFHPSRIDPFMLFRSEIFEEWKFDDTDTPA